MKTSVSEKAKIGIMICGHKEYWPQFPGLKEQLTRQGEMFAEWVGETGVSVVSVPFVDTVEDSYKAGIDMKKQDIDLLFVYLTTYVSSGRYMQGALAADCPIVVVATKLSLDFSGAKQITIHESIAAGGLTPLAESYSAFVRCGKRPAGMIFGELAKTDYMLKEIDGWCKAANAMRAFKGSVFGYMGHTYEGMYDMNFDPTSVTKSFGVHVRFVEMCELVGYIENCSEEDLKAKLDQINETFIRTDRSYDGTTKDIDNSDLTWAAKVSVALDKLILNNGLSGLSYYYLGENNSIYERAASNMTIGNTLMTSKGITMAGEADMKTCLAMYLTSAFGCGGSFCEFVSCDFNADMLLVGHDGPHDIRISDKKPTIRGLGIRHGKRGEEVSVEFSLKHGPITMVALGSDENGRYNFIYAEGESCEGWLPEIGNTVTRGYFGPDVAEFVRDWSSSGTTHHASLAVGHCGHIVEKFGKMMNIDVIRIR